jgi:hypothetical protein
MAISIFRWTDGPYLAFNDQDDRRYILEGGRATTLLDRLGAHFCDRPDRALVIDRHFTRDLQRDLVITDIFLQDCDNLFEVMTATSPMLLASPRETCTLLLMAADILAATENRPDREIPNFLKDSLVSTLVIAEGNMGVSYG